MRLESGYKAHNTVKVGIAKKTANKADKHMMTIKEIRNLSGMTQVIFSEAYGIPLRTIKDWERGARKPPDYLCELLERAVKDDLKQKNIS